MQLTSILQMRAAYWENLQVKTRHDQKEEDFWLFEYLQLVNTSKYALRNMFIYIITEQFQHKRESTWRR